MHHPFRCLVAGPSQSGKSTFVRNLLLHQKDIIDVCFDYVTIVLGTDAHKNEILSSLKDELRPGVVEIIELKKLYKTAELMKQNFCSEFEHFVKDKANKKKKGCVIFDDLMSELSEFFEEEGGDLPRSESYSNDEEEEREEPLKSDGDSQGCTPVTASTC